MRGEDLGLPQGVYRFTSRYRKYDRQNQVFNICKGPKEKLHDQ